MAPSSEKVRDFREEDLPEVIELCEQTQVKNPHFIRDKASLSHFLSNSSSDKKKVFIAEKDGGITGFVVTSITVEQDGLKQGNILEMQVKDTSSLPMLVKVASDYCGENDVDAIVAVAPLVSEAAEAFKGWIEFDTGVMMAKGLTPAPLLEAMFSSKRVRNFLLEKKINFNVDEDLVKIEVRPAKNQAFQTDNRQNQSVAHVLMSSEVFLKLALGKLNPYSAYFLGKVKIKGAKNPFSLLKLLSLIRIDSHFFTALADRM